MKENKSQNVIEEDITDSLDDKNTDSSLKFKCDCCGFQAKTEKGLKTHKGRKHKPFIQLDGNISSEDLEEQEKTYMELKAIFVAEDEISAEADLRKFYIGEIISDYSEEIKLIENESGEEYDGLDSFYTKRKYKIFTFTFNISKKYAWEDIKKIMFTDQVKDLFII